MKKGMFFALAASSLLFGACSSDDAVVNTTAQNEAVQQIVLQVASSGDGLTTRAGRPLYSSQALQTIENVRVLIYKNDTKEGSDKTIVFDKNYDWTSSVTYTTNGHGRQLTISLKGKDKLEKGKYTIMAVGYSKNSDYDYKLDATVVTDAPSLKDKAYKDITATLKSGKNAAEEVFAGDAAIDIDDNKEIVTKTTGENGVAVTLHRQVAGAFGYFKNIPASVDGKVAKTLRLVTRSKNNTLTFNGFNSSFTAANTAGSTIKYYINGSTTGPAFISDATFLGGDPAYVLYSINLDDWYKNGDKDHDGLLTEKDGWTHADIFKNTILVQGSVFGSNFIIPFGLTQGENTMELQLLDGNDTIIKTWNVSIPSADVNKNQQLGAIDESTSIFNVVRNHMYNLGVKLYNGGTVDPEPGKPNPDPKPDPKPDPTNPDKPEDLSKGQNLILKVNDNWEAIHQMELD